MSDDALLAVAIRQLPHGDGLPFPTYQSAGAAGADLFAAIAPDAKIVIEPGARLLVPSGIVIQMPDGYEAQVRPRSGLALQHGITVLNAPGTVDCDYRGEIGVLLVNLGSEPFEVIRGARIAQLVVAPVKRAAFVAATTLGETQRGTGGYGSTGSREKKG